MISLATAYVVKKELFFIKVEENVTVMVIQLEMLLEYLLVFLKMTEQQVNKLHQTTTTTTTNNDNNKQQQQITTTNTCSICLQLIFFSFFIASHIQRQGKSC